MKDHEESGTIQGTYTGEKYDVENEHGGADNCIDYDECVVWISKRFKIECAESRNIASF